MSRLKELKKMGQSPWLDFISRDILENGELARMISEDGISGVTSNPTIFEKAVASSKLYDDFILSQRRQGKTAQEIVRNLIIRDAQDAADLLRGVYEESGGEDGFVSIEVPPDYAYDVEATVTSARELFELAGRENVLIKVPATREGLEAMSRLISQGVNVNATLIFSLEHYRGVVQAYFRGLKERLELGRPLERVTSVASVFVSRFDTAVDRILDRIKEENPEAGQLRGKAALAHCRMVYIAFKESLSSAEFQSLKAHGARVQKLVWGSTSTKDPTYSDTKYVSGLIAPETINTMPPQTIQAFQDHGEIGPSLEQGVEEAREILSALSALGIDLEAIGEELQKEGVRLFAHSWKALLASVERVGRG